MARRLCSLRAFFVCAPVFGRSVATIQARKGRKGRKGRRLRRDSVAGPPAGRDAAGPKRSAWALPLGIWTALARVAPLQRSDWGNSQKKPDWSERDSVRAKLRLMVKCILRKYKYPPDLQEGAVELVLQQAQVMGESWAG